MLLYYKLKGRGVYKRFCAQWQRERFAYFQAFYKYGFQVCCTLNWIGIKYALFVSDF